MKKIFVMALFMAIASAGYSQIKLGVSGSYLVPSGDFADGVDSGFGVSVNGEVGVSIIAVTGELGFRSFQPKFGDNVNAISALLGVKKGLPGPVYVELRGGLLNFSEDGVDDEVVLIPAIGARFAKFDANIGYQLLNDINYINLRVAYFFL